MSPHQTPIILTPFQVKIVRQLAKNGGSNKEIADELGYSETTPRTHICEALKITGLHSRTALALWWIRKGQYQYNEDNEYIEPQISLSLYPNL
jgi:DNA-binding NarL/FixJ family response regulator